MHIRDAVAGDAEALVTIYNHFICHTTISFEEKAITQSEMAQRIADVQASDLPWLVAEHDGAIAGYAYATKWRVRHAYRFSVESSVYLAPAAAGRGIGTALYSALLEGLVKQGRCHLVIAGIAFPNAASIALHEKLGFEKAAQFREVGFKFDRWIDVGYWQKTLSGSENVSPL